MKYKQSAIGFSKEKQKKQQEKKAALLRQQRVFYVLGYGQWLNWSELEPDCLTFTQKFWEPANTLFTLLANGQYLEAGVALSNGPWNTTDLSLFLLELDNWALLCNEDRRALGPAVTEQVRQLLNAHGVETFYDALQEKHRESFEAAESLQHLLEKEMGAEMVDSGALYDANGNQESGRDLVLELKNGAEVALQVYHNPRKVTYEGTIPERMQDLIAQWEVATA